MSESLLVACFLLLLLQGAAVLIIFHKVRKVHLCSFKLLDQGEHVRREATVLFQQIQALMALERRLQLPQALPPMRGWAGSPDFLLALAEELLEGGGRPRTVLECSSGVSTLVMARCMQLLGQGHVYSLEHEGEYASKTRGLLSHYGLQEWATVIDAPLCTDATETPWYSLRGLPNDLLPVDVLVVDGPPHAVAKLARYPALPSLLPRMAPGFTVFLDDADREAELEIVRRWLQDVPSMKLTRIQCEKGLAVLRSGDEVLP